ncbi:fungal hydrophobin [Panus rudis PR-1116 ss-1]|nr:fungal hydrophobin [Panus rudis PR-1116 ss-1]
MFSRLAAFATLALPVLAVATPAHLDARQSCSTGPIQCCESTATAGSATGAALLGLLGIVVQDLNVLLGVDCSPISVGGVGGGNCGAQAVCCENNNVGGGISLGCVPVTL